MSKQGRGLQVLFDLSMILKAVDGLAEFLGGIIFVSLGKSRILEIISDILYSEYFKIPTDTIEGWLDYLARTLTTSVETLIVLILIGNGLVKLVLAINLLLKKRWAFYWGMAFLIILIIYQIIQNLHFKSIVFNLFNVFDILVVTVIWLQYRQLMKTHSFIPK